MKKLYLKELKRMVPVKAISFGIVLIVAIVMTFSGSAIATEKWTFKFPTFEPEHSLFSKQYWHWWCYRVEELSEGRVKFEKYPGQTLIKAPDIFEAVKDGICETGLFTIPYEAGFVPLPTAKELPFSFVDFDTHHYMWLQFMKVGLQDYFHSYNVHCVADSAWDAYSFWTSKRWGPIEKLEDLKGCKIRSPGGQMSEACKAMGAVPVAMPSPEAYTAMERGTLDCLTMPESSNIAFSLEEVTAYICRPDYATTGVPIIVNLDVWNSLPKEIQDIMHQAGEEAYFNCSEQIIKADKEMVAPIVEKRGIKVVDLDPKERERMRKACASVWDKWLEDNGDTFNGLGKKMYDIVVRTVGRP